MNDIPRFPEQTYQWVVQKMLEVPKALGQIFELGADVYERGMKEKFPPRPIEPLLQKLDKKVDQTMNLLSEIEDLWNTGVWPAIRNNDFLMHALGYAEFSDYTIENNPWARPLIDAIPGWPSIIRDWGGAAEMAPTAYLSRIYEMLVRLKNQIVEVREAYDDSERREYVLRVLAIWSAEPFYATEFEEFDSIVILGTLISAAYALLAWYPDTLMCPEGMSASPYRYRDIPRTAVAPSSYLQTRRAFFLPVQCYDEKELRDSLKTLRAAALSVDLGDYIREEYFPLYHEFGEPEWELE